MNEKYNNLKKIRKERGLTVKEVVEGAGIPMRTYQNYEYMEREIGAGTLQKLADFYGVTTDYLLGREPAPDPFADLNLNKESEEDVIDKYMSLPPNIRACLMDVLLQLADAAKQRQNAQPEEDTPGSKLSVSTALGTIEDEIEKMAMAKGGA
ncbi:MAG: helix-turn-helix domain-containing protein [Ruminococcus sp.]